MPQSRTKLPGRAASSHSRPASTDANAKLRVSYQGEPGANSHLACLEVFPDCDPVACPTFEDALASVKSGDTHYAMIPIENSVAGRVADIHHLLPNAQLYIVGEHFLRVRHQLMARPGASLESIKTVMSHTQALGQCRNTLRRLGLRPVPEADTAGSARLVSEHEDLTQAAIASTLAAEIYGLNILKSDIEDEAHNTTRFVILAAEPDDAEPGKGPFVTTFLFRVRNVPAALYKAMGGFATNGVNMTKLESYQVNGAFIATMFYADIDGHPADESVRLAMEELSFFSSELHVLGTYPASPYRAQVIRNAGLG
ncbi:prephenate dehydratase [Leptospira interrogans]